MPETRKPLYAGKNDEGKRLDRIIRTLLPHLPLSAVYRLIRRGLVKVNGQQKRIAYRLRAGDRIDMGARLLSMLREDKPPDQEYSPADIHNRLST